MRIQLINAHHVSLASAIAETGAAGDCVGNECSDIESEQTRQVGREASRAAGRQRKRGIHQRGVDVRRSHGLAVAHEQAAERCALESAEVT